MLGHGSRLHDLFGEERMSLRASDIGVKVWSLGGVGGGETCTPVQPIVSRMALSLSTAEFIVHFHYELIAGYYDVSDISKSTYINKYYKMMLRILVL